MDAKKLIALTGFMGSGKSRIGREISGRIGIPFYDLDEIIEREEKKRITEIFQAMGEPHFRMLEYKYLRDLIGEKRGVIALGGGAIQKAEIRDLLERHAITVYLNVPMETLVQRLKKDKNRPLLRNSDGKLLEDQQLRSRIAEILERREPLYQKADIVLGIQPGWTRNQTAHELICLLKTYAPDTIA